MSLSPSISFEDSSQMDEPSYNERSRFPVEEHIWNDPESPLEHKKLIMPGYVYESKKLVPAPDDPFYQPEKRSDPTSLIPNSSRYQFYFDNKPPIFNEAEKIELQLVDRNVLITDIVNNFDESLSSFLSLVEQRDASENVPRAMKASSRKPRGASVNNPSNAHPVQSASQIPASDDVPHIIRAASQMPASKDDPRKAKATSQKPHDSSEDGPPKKVRRSTKSQQPHDASEDVPSKKGRGSSTKAAASQQSTCKKLASKKPPSRTKSVSQRQRNNNVSQGVVASSISVFCQPASRKRGNDGDSDDAPLSQRAKRAASVPQPIALLNDPNSSFQQDVLAINSTKRERRQTVRLGE